MFATPYSVLKPAGFRSLAALLLLGLLPVALVVAQDGPRIAVPEEADTAPLDQLVPLDPALRTGQLDNGLRYFIRANGEPANRAELRLIVDVGSLQEDDDQLGLAHVVEHMAFNGTENFAKQALVQFMESIGMRMGSDLNASTSFDQTMYMLRVPTDSPVPLVEALRIMHDWAGAIAFDADEIEQERRVVIEEWRGGQNANSRVTAQQFPVVLADSRFAERLPIGTLASLQNFDHDALKRFYRDWYRPDLMAVVVVGDIDVDAVESLVSDLFSGLTVPEDSRERIRYEVPDHAGTRVSIVTDEELTSTTLGVAYRLDEDRDWTIGGARERVTAALYSNMFSLRLAEIARQAPPPFILGLGARSDSFLSSGAAFILTALVQGNGVERALEVLLTESRRVTQFGFTEAELERTRSTIFRQIENQLANRDSQPSASFASQYANLFLRGAPTPGIEYDARLTRRLVNDITLEDINAIGRDWVGDSNRILLVTAPENETSLAPDEAALLAILDSTGDAEIEAYADSGDGRELLPVLPAGAEIVADGETVNGLTEWTLANGVRVILKPTDFDEDVILFRAYSPGGISLAADEDFVAARTALRLIGSSGLGELDANAVRQTLAGTIATANPYINEFDEGLSGSSTQSDLETLFQLIYLRFTAPRIDESALDVFKAQAELFLGNRDRSPALVFEDRFTRLMTQDHPRFRPETLAIVEQTDPDKSLAFYRDRFADAGDFTFVFVGSVDPAALRPLVERYLGGLPATGRDETWRDVGMRQPSGIIEETIFRGLEPVGRTRIAISGPFAIEDTFERTLLTATGRVLQSHLREVLREDLGATYNVSIAAASAWLPEKKYSIVIEFSSDPERIDELVERVFAEIAALKANGPAEADVTEARESMLRQFEGNLEQNAYWIGVVAASDQYGFDIGEQWEIDYPGSIESLSTERLQDGLRRYVDLENYVRLSLLPESMAP